MCCAQGMVCLDILKDQWTPAFSIEKILLSIYCLLQECNPGKLLLCTYLGQALIQLCATLATEVIPKVQISPRTCIHVLHTSITALN